MLRVISYANGIEHLPLFIEGNKWYVKHAYDGLDTLRFEIASVDPMYKYIAEEVKVLVDNTSCFVVKKIDERGDFATVVCELDLDDWKREIYVEFRETNATLEEVLRKILPGNWSYRIASGTYTKRTTVEGENEGEPMYGATPYEVLIKAATTYGCVFNYDNVTKMLYVVDPTQYEPSGDFFSDEVNLNSLGFTGISTNFATRLYAYGKKDEESGKYLTFADINDGKEYVEDTTYSDKVVAVGWVDERYTVKENLLSDAKKKLQELARPSRSYTCEVNNLDKRAWMYRVVTLIDRKHNTRVDHQVVEFIEYPDEYRHLNTVTLSATSPQISTNIEKITSSLQNSVIKERSERKDAIDRLAEAQAQAAGLYETTETRQGGAVVHYLHDNKVLAESTLIITLSERGITVSKDGGATVSYAFDFVTGDAIAQTIYAGAAWLDKLFAQDLTATNLHITGNSTLNGELVSHVSDMISESYDNAKEAYNKATDAKSAVDNLAIGGRNLALGTSSNWRTYSVVDEIGCAPWALYLFDMKSRGLKAGDTIQIGFDIQFSNDFEATLTDMHAMYLQGDYNYGGTEKRITFDGGNQQQELETILATQSKFGHINTYFIVTEDMLDDDYTGEWEIKLRFDSYLGFISIRNAKVELGTISTNWTPAPEDVDAAIQEAEANANSYTESKISQTADEIEISIHEVAGVLTEDVNACQEAIAATDASLSDSISDLEGRVSTQEQDLANYKSETSMYFRFNTNGLNIGKLEGGDDSPYSINIDNEKMAFLQNGMEVAYVQYNKLHINAVEAMDRLSVGAAADGGYFDFISTQYGMGVKWRSV